jgi:hypothetical protein
MALDALQRRRDRPRALIGRGRDNVEVLAGSGRAGLVMRGGVCAAPRPAVLVSLAGASIATWEGERLVIFTMQIRPQLATPGAPAFDQQRRIAERFNLITPDQISYEPPLEDSAMLTALMHVHYSFLRTDHAVFGSACHEGNYSIVHMMLGARLMEQAEAAKPAPKSKP